MKLKPCPFCKRTDVVSIIVCDDKGNYRGELGCAYDQYPWSGLSYALVHAGWGECLLCTDDNVMGGILFDSAKEAAEAWNRSDDNQRRTAMKYDVRLGLDASLWVSVEASSEEEAKDKAFEKLTESNLGDLSMVQVRDYRIEDVQEPPKEEEA